MIVWKSGTVTGEGYGSAPSAGHRPRRTDSLDGASGVATQWPSAPPLTPTATRKLWVRARRVPPILGRSPAVLTGTHGRTDGEADQT